MILPRTRFARWKPLPARLLLALLLALCGYGIVLALQPAPAADPVLVDLSRTDLALYKRVAERVGEGESYYAVVAGEQRARGYPLRPVVTVRLPTLAWTIGLIGPERASLLLKLLCFAGMAALALRLRTIAGSKPVWAASAFATAASMILLTVPVMTYWHESWAALLIVLSLACRSRERWAASVPLGLAAALFRELALPYLLLMLAFAIRDRNRSEAAAWGAAALLFFMALGAHAAALAAHLQPGDPASPGWASAGGWSFVLALVQRCTVLALLPMPWVAVAVPLALLGWTAAGHSTSDRTALLLCGYLCAFMMIGRSDNFYWGILIAPLLPIGLALAPAALRDLTVAAASAEQRRNLPPRPSV